MTIDVSNLTEIIKRLSSRTPTGEIPMLYELDEEPHTYAVTYTHGRISRNVFNRLMLTRTIVSYWPERPTLNAYRLRGRNR